MTSIQQVPDRQLSLWDRATQSQAVVEHVFSQKTVIKKDNKYAFIGVPFLITSVTFQPPVDDSDQEIPDFVSLECQIAPAHAVEDNAKGGWIPNCRSTESWVECYTYKPDEYFVLNDGSKGIRRQIVEMLHWNKLINAGNDIKSDSHPSVFDRPWTLWESFSQSATRSRDDEDEKLVIPSFTQGSRGDDLLIPVLRGLRASKDPKAPAGHSDTFYLS